MGNVNDIRPSPIAGKWYQADSQKLGFQIDGYLHSATPMDVSGDVVGIMAPHAGHIYSGQVAAYAFNLLRDMMPEIVAIVSPMHYPYREPLLTTSHSAYETPLGIVPVDQGIVNELDRRLVIDLGFGLTKVTRDQEHSLEIELPFLQRALANPFRLLPIMVRDQTQFITKTLGRALAAVLAGKSALLVASTDLSHFYPERIAKIYDGNMLEQVAALDPVGVLEVEEQGRGFACGKGALAAVIWAAKDLGANQAKVLNYSTSGAVTRDYSQVVGYGAAAFIRKLEADTNP